MDATPIKPAVKPAPKPAVKPAVKPAPKSASKSVPKSAPKLDLKLDPRPTPRPSPRARARAARRAAAEAKLLRQAQAMPPPERGHWTVAEAARVWDISTGWVRQLIRRGRVKATLLTHLPSPYWSIDVDQPPPVERFKPV